MSAKDVAAKIVAAGLTEDAGRNCDKKGVITAMLHFVGVAPGNSWCAAFVSWAFNKAGAGTKFPYSGSSQALKAAFKQQGHLFTDPDELNACLGAIAGWTDVNDPWHGHVFIVSERYTLNGRVVAIGTLEGNTNGAGAANGDGAYHKKRVLALDGLFYPVDKDGNHCGPGHALWFCNTSSIGPAGQWWEAA